MIKEEFKQFCHMVFTQYGFRKKKNMYFQKGTDGLLCGLMLQGGYDYYYINCYYFIGTFDERKSYPAYYEHDLYGRPICVLSKDTFNGDHFMDAMIEYEEYTEKELMPYFEKAFCEIIMPPLLKGKGEILHQEKKWVTPLDGGKSREEILDSLRK